MTTQHTGRLSLQYRPEEVVLWSRQRDSVPSIADVEQFNKEWLIWWGSCQPKWRPTETWPYPRDDAKAKDWARLDVSGPHGLFAFIMSTAWWATSADSDLHREAFGAVVEDIHWVIENLIYFNSRLQVTGPEPTAAVETRFPGHGDREPGKRKIKPTPKVCNR